MTLNLENYEIDEDSNGDLVYKDPGGATVLKWNDTANQWEPSKIAAVDIVDKSTSNTVYDSSTETIGDGNQDANLNATSTGELTGTYPGDFRAIADGQIVASIDPTSTTTPLRDSLDAIDNATGRGTVIVPPGTHTEGSKIPAGKLQFKYVIGHGTRTSIIEFTTLSADGIECGPTGGISETLIHNLALDGSDAANRTAGSALHFTSATKAFNLGHVKFQSWGGDPVVWFDTGHAYSSYWMFPTFYLAGNRATNFQIDDAGAPLTIGTIDLGSDTAVPGIQTSGTTAGKLCINGAVNVGGSITEALDLQFTGNGQITIRGPLNYEPDTFPGSNVAPVILRGAGMYSIGAISVNGNAWSSTLDRAVALLATPENNNIGHINAVATSFNTAPIDITSDTGGLSNTYEGPVSDINNSTGSNLSSPIVGKSDVTKKVSTGTGYDGGTADTRL